MLPEQLPQGEMMSANSAAEIQESMQMKSACMAVLYFDALVLLMQSQRDHKITGGL